MLALTIPDLVGLGFFLLAWSAYSRFVRYGFMGEQGLNERMNEFRFRWMVEMSRREQRMVDSSVMGSLQNGAAFFTSTSLIAVGGAITMLRATDDMLRIFADLPLGLVADRTLWELKSIGLLIIFGYAFFKFAWAYRLFNFAAILIGATPSRNDEDEAARDQMVRRAARMNMVAGSHFTRGQRAFFFALAYLGWFLGPWVFMVATAAVIYVMWARQFRSEARRALDGAPFETDYK
jgi:uncharacterized membrane protein